ncbi:endonuclease/exonuclease/phosphatase family metal-dependent hydrolase [Nocardioides ginsengisegetis]|uniref:Endonuclease/exonuclease/phosphatase family metal-dependent hydrolase n=1 Tax=Nocardioides ginsengisegetis TaxID=661491 RepID=A0A7W3PAK0_9ACTN|nr:endonuclease/exonuclease/phosphatase family metal-dependent hydrolase [Nocardioides ginsengisegetis]
MTRRFLGRRSGVVLTLLAALALTGLTSPVQARTPAAKVPQDAAFQIATFNILGSQHTLGPGGYGPGALRAAITARLIERKGLDLVGMQEVQADQLEVLRHDLDGFDIWPGDRLGPSGLRLQIAWRTSKFELLETGTITTTFDHQMRPIPWVRLLNRKSQRQLYVVDVHNSPRGQEHDRDKATRHEIRLVDELRATHKAVFLIGDMNEHEEVFCSVVGRTDLVAANGGTATSADDCQPPTGWLHIDWIFGGGPLTFSDYGWEDGASVRAASDHDLVHATVTLPARGDGA